MQNESVSEIMARVVAEDIERESLAIPAFLDRKLNGIVTPMPRDARSKPLEMKTRLSIAERLESARCEGTRILILEQEAERKEAAKDAAKIQKNGVTIRLNIRLENCPLEPGEHRVELVHLGRKWCRFRCVGRVNAVKVRRVIWDAIAA